MPDGRGAAKKLSGRVAEFLFTGGVDPPPEYAEYVAIKQLYHCRPSELEKEDWATVSLHLAFLAEDAKAMKREMG